MNTFDAISAGAASLAHRRAKSEIDLLGALLADHRRLVHVAAGAGLRGRHFSADDLKLIYEACVTRHNCDRRDVLAAAMASLQENHYWDRIQIVGNLGQSLWSAESLVALADSRYPSAIITKYHATEVIRLHDLEAEIRATYDRLIALLKPDAKPSTAQKQIARAA